MCLHYLSLRLKWVSKAKRIVREMGEEERKENISPISSIQKTFNPWRGNLVTAIGFELVRRNTRILLDRLAHDEPLIPSERINIGFPS